ncbi:MAG TPA: endonuclease/exonuclease/phosphatase family protein [Candidatus Paceibacterota bacterium]|nr:endonuclease/exonuclease/phosphatase family protein [Candidatus Paceibacterota bacterium]
MHRKRVTVLSLNMMHGRHTVTPLVPVKVPRAKILRNLERIAALVKDSGADIVALQEIDQHAWLSDYVDQLDQLQQMTGYPYAFFGDHVSAKKAVYGTAILSKHPIKKAVSRPFRKTFPTPRKGFVFCEIELPSGKVISVASIHATWINILSRATREKQMNEIIEHFRAIDTPFILSGDFNSHFARPLDRSLETLVKGLPIFAHAHHDNSQITYPKTKRRIDWIFPSKHFKIIEYATIDSRVSDHLPLLATLELTAHPEREASKKKD